MLKIMLPVFMMLSRLMLKSKIKQIVYKVLSLCPVC